LKYSCTQEVFIWLKNPVENKNGFVLCDDVLTKYRGGMGHVIIPDECISIDGFLEAMEITALMLLKCDKME
jgi:hypothetical protein